MTTVRRLAPVALVTLVVVGVLLGGSALASGGSGTPIDPTDVLGPGPVTVTLRVEHSRFEPSEIRVRPGTDVRFVVDNGDPINHELIVGDEEVHRRHEQGNEAYHPPIPGEVSVPASATAETTFGFGDTGGYEFACHLPGHLRYGMRGTVEVVA